MPYKEVATAFDLDGAFNYLTLTLAPGGSERSVIAELDRLLTPYGGRGAYGRADHPSHIRVSDEIRVLRTLSIGFPMVFLSVAAFMTNAVLSRLLTLQREQIAILKAFGFTNRQIVVALSEVRLRHGGGRHGARRVRRGAAGPSSGDAVSPVLPVSGPGVSSWIEPPFRWRLLVCAAAATVGVFSAVRRAARLPPAEAMRPSRPPITAPRSSSAPASRASSRTRSASPCGTSSASRRRRSSPSPAWRWPPAF